jgi:glycerophosphodiester phosphodiesterase
LFALDRELEKVDGFYTYKGGEIDRRLWVLSEKFKQQHDAATVHTIQPPMHQSEFLLTPQDQRPLDNPHANSQFVSALRETLDQLNKLMWFAELNKKGFGKILKK